MKNTLRPRQVIWKWNKKKQQWEGRIEGTKMFFYIATKESGKKKLEREWAKGRRDMLKYYFI